MNATTKDLHANVSILFSCHFTAIFRGILSSQPAHRALNQMEVVPPWPGRRVADVAAGLALVRGSPTGQFWALAGSQEPQLEQRAALLH